MVGLCPKSDNAVVSACPSKNWGHFARYRVTRVLFRPTKLRRLARAKMAANDVHEQSRDTTFMRLRFKTTGGNQRWD